MKTKALFIAALSITLLASVITIYAHPGNTDSNGGHYVRTAGYGYPVGSYHYHHGSDRSTAYDANGNIIKPIVGTSTTTPIPIQPTAIPIPQGSGIDKFYKEFPNVPNYGYYAKLAPINTYNQNGVYVYQYDVSKTSYDAAYNTGVEWGEAFSDAGFTDYDTVEGGIVIWGAGLQILARQSSIDIFSVTIGKLPISDAVESNITVLIDGTPIEFETAPRMINDRIMVQIRPIAEKLGCTVTWDADTQTSYINQPNVPLQKNAVKGSDINVYVNNMPIEFPDQKPAIIDDYVMIPCRGVVEALGYSVSWDADSQTQAITTN